MGRDLNRDGEAVGKCSAVNAPIVHQRSVDFVKNEADAAAIKLLWQVSDGEPNAGGIHEDFFPSVICRISFALMGIFIQ